MRKDKYPQLRTDIFRIIKYQTYLPPFKPLPERWVMQNTEDILELVSKTIIMEKNNEQNNKKDT